MIALSVSINLLYTTSSSCTQGELEGAKPASNWIKCRAKPCLARRAWSTPRVLALRREATIFAPQGGTKIKRHTLVCLFIFGGAEGSRTPVRKHFNRTFSERSQVSTFPPRADTGQTARFSRVIMRGRGNSYPPHGRHSNDAFPGLWPLRFRRLPLVRQRQQYDCCQLIFKLPVLWRSGAAARLSCLCTPVETGAAPY